MRDDLFEFVAAQEVGLAAQEAWRATEHKRPAEIRSIIDKIKSHKRSLCGQRKSGHA